LKRVFTCDIIERAFRFRCIVIRVIERQQNLLKQQKFNFWIVWTRNAHTWSSVKTVKENIVERWKNQTYIWHQMTLVELRYRESTNVISTLGPCLNSPFHKPLKTAFKSNSPFHKPLKTAFKSNNIDNLKNSWLMP